MAQDSFKNLVIGFSLFGLVVIMITTIVYQMGINYGVSSEKMQVTTGGALDLDNYESELIGSDQDAENYRRRFESGEVEDVDDASGVFSVLGDLIDMITTPFQVLGNMSKNLLGTPNIALHTFLAILNVLILLGIWRVIRAGD